jgi:SAM-dependent methyltransferase
VLVKFARWLRYNLRYFGRPPWDSGVSPPELLDYLVSAEPGIALDAGCGTGTNMLTMASLGWKVVGVDYAWLSLLKARTRLKKAGVKGRVLYGDITCASFPEESFDLVLDIGCYHSLKAEEREAYRENLLRWLKPGGAFLLYAHRKTLPEARRGISEEDITRFSQNLHLLWREDSDEQLLDGGGGHSATWARFENAGKVV